MGLFRKNGKQRMGSGINSCKNLNNWAHLFNPNSPSALQGEIACDIHWGKATNVNTTRSGDLDDRKSPNTEPLVLDANGNRISKAATVAYLPGQEPSSQENQTPDSNGRKIVVLILVLLVLGYGFKNL